jgi:glycosidase
VTILYFNPLFEAKSTHKYDAADYRKIDPHFGTNDEFKAFVKEAKARGIRIILDIVFNHSGNARWAFRDAVEKAPLPAATGTRSSSLLPAGWPNVGYNWKPGDYYNCWWGFGDLPNLNFDLSRDDKAEIPIRDVKDAQPNIALVKYLLDSTEYWLKEVDADGVRLDVPNEVPDWFWKLFNKRVKTVKPDAYIVGELWGNASDYVKPGMYDAVMNYAFFRDPVLKFLCNAQGTAAEFDAALATGRLTYPRQSVAVQMNLIDSHDTVRYLTQANGNVDRLDARRALPDDVRRRAGDLTTVTRSHSRVSATPTAAARSRGIGSRIRSGPRCMPITRRSPTCAASSRRSAPVTSARSAPTGRPTRTCAATRRTRSSSC